MVDPLHKVGISDIRSRKALDERVSYIGTDPSRFARLMDVVFCREGRPADKASWIMIHIVEKHPELLSPFREKILDLLDDPKTQIMLKRNVIKSFVAADLPKKRLGLLTDRCFQFLALPSSGKALRVYSLNVLERIVEIFPELKAEYFQLLEGLMEEEIAWLNIKARKILKKNGRV